MKFCKMKRILNNSKPDFEEKIFQILLLFIYELHDFTDELLARTIERWGGVRNEDYSEEKK